MNDLQTLLVSGQPLWISVDGFRQAMLKSFPPNGEKVAMPMAEIGVINPTQREFLNTHTWYQLETRIMLDALRTSMTLDESVSGISLTDEFNDDELPDETIAYHRVWGTVMADSYWFFSSKQLAADLLAAESNPKIICHFLHINSPGGEAWYLDRLSDVLISCTKPIVTLYEQMCCSAGYYIGCHGRKVYALTANDYVGCIGTMCSFYDFEEYFAKLGIKRVEARASASDLKNKTFDDLRHGDGEKYVNDFLNPLNEQFLSEVRSQRSSLAELPDDAPVLRGETFYTAKAVDIGLADGTRTFVEAVGEALLLGRDFAETQRLKKNIYNIV